MVKRMSPSHFLLIKSSLSALLGREPPGGATLARHVTKSFALSTREPFKYAAILLVDAIDTSTCGTRYFTFTAADLATPLAAPFSVTSSKETA